MLANPPLRIPVSLGSRRVDVGALRVFARALVLSTFIARITSATLSAAPQGYEGPKPPPPGRSVSPFARTARAQVGSEINRRTIPLAADTPPPATPVPSPAGPTTGTATAGTDLPPLPPTPDVLGPQQIRLRTLPEEEAYLGMTPKPSTESQDKLNRYVDKVVDPETTFDVIVNRPRVMILKEVPVRYQIEEESVARVIPLLENRQLSVSGLRVGTTILNLWFGDPNTPENQTVLSFLIRSLPDPEARQRLERVYDALADEINRLFPDSVVKLAMAGDKLVVSGQAKDVVEASQILRIVAANAPGGGGGGNLSAPAVSQIPIDSRVSRTEVDPLTGGLVTTQVGTIPSPNLSNYPLAGLANVINLLKVPGEQQVMLRVTVAEVNRAAARSIGVDFSVSNRNGDPVFINTTGRLTNTLGSGGGGTGGGGTGSFRGSNNLIALFDNGRIFVAIAALRTMNFARTLAEPTLTTTNGQPAAFQAGGRFPVPIVSGATLTGLQGVTFIPYGVQLNFTPYVTDRDRIRLVVNSDVSVRDLLATTNVGNSSVPGLTTRNFSTTVELREGQTLAVAGLIQTSYGANSSRVPGIGDLPLIGRIGAYDTNSYSEQELVVLITPELVHPYDPKQVPPLPGSDIFEPGDLEFFLLGRLESRREYDYRSAVRTDIHRMARYRHCEDVFIRGPHGHSDGRP